MSERAEATEPRTLSHVDVEALRVPVEVSLAARLSALPGWSEAAERCAPPPAESVRRSLLASSVRLTPAMAPEMWSVATRAKEVLGVEKSLEIYQSAGRENAAIHLLEEPVVLQVMGRFVHLLDRGAALAVFGHELGHYLAHGPSSPLGHTGAIAHALLHDRAAPPALTRLAAALSLAQELTADRFGLLACQDLSAHLRLEMICTTGLHGDALTWDTDVYLSQCRELIETVLREGDSARGRSHPEHGVRAWAAWRFFETREYQSLTGIGPGSCSLAEVNAEVERVLALPSLDARWHMFDAPPPERDECALAGCVLVAAADGALSDVERDAIERAFSARIKDLRAYLDPAYARERLAEVAPVVRAAGEDVVRSVFFILLRVCAADGVLHDAEVETVLAIGEFLDARPLFDRLMAAVRRTTQTAPPTTTPPAVSPLPRGRGRPRRRSGCFCRACTDVAEPRSPCDE